MHVSYGLHNLRILFSILIGSFESRHFTLYGYIFHVCKAKIYTEFRAQVHRDRGGRKHILFAFIILQKGNVLLLL